MTKELKKEQMHSKKPQEAGSPFVTIALLSVATFVCAISLLSYKATDSSIIFDTTTPQPLSNVLGVFGAECAALLLYLFGVACWFIPITLAYCLRTVLFGLTWKREIDRIAGLLAFTVVGAAIANCFSFELYRGIYPGGWFGELIVNLLAQFFTPEHTTLFLFSLSWALGLIVARFSFISYLYPLSNYIQQLPVRAWIAAVNNKLNELLGRASQQSAMHEKQRDLTPAYPAEFDVEAQLEIQNSAQERGHSNETILARFHKKLTRSSSVKNEDHLQALPATRDDQDELIEDGEPTAAVITGGEYKIPPLSLFTTLKEPAPDSSSLTDGEQRAQTLEHKLERFGIKGKVVSITHGPAVTLFEYQPSIDTKISTILAREDDLALALQALSLRIIAPIPGRSVIGFEVAHNKRKPVFFSHALKSPAFASFQGSLPLILGKDTLGHDQVIDLAAMPHLLVAGSTGSGKSVGLHTMIMSLVCSKTPAEVKFILIDPKRLEFSNYADMPHLIFPIVTDPRRAVAVLKWALNTMEDRYAVMAQAGVRNCTEYNSRSKPGHEEYFPLIVIIIDELADLMMTAGKEVEHNITRLAQMARAAGIHMIAATQRPSVDVITGLIKVNFPSRIAYKVTTKVDSRTILDMMGAEKLLGKGDMLFLDAKGSVQRIHGAYVTDSEIQSVTQYCKQQQSVVYQELTSHKNNEEGDGDGDELFQEVINYIKNKDEVSISLIQRVFRIGYNRSARLIDQLESYGYLLPADGGKMRKVSKDQ